MQAAVSKKHSLTAEALKLKTDNGKDGTRFTDYFDL